MPTIISAHSIVSVSQKWHQRGRPAGQLLKKSVNDYLKMKTLFEHTESDDWVTGSLLLVAWLGGWSRPPETWVFTPPHPASPDHQNLKCQVSADLVSGSGQTAHTKIMKTSNGSSKIIRE